ncbi:3-octaprenyl-4-hydroxybenzoate carboxy-lyase [Brucella vulpis]|nr:3-octaprenyl-4-hydroxybenzoate carboxy-lyase [Brucella vulpis]CUW51970.1 3-octaprenyl-4-hydroxybenzoate carboxy-lyase [Brucella vulpis]
MKRIVIGVSGASGSLIPLKLLERLAVMEEVETHLVISDAAQQTLRYELGANGYSLLYRLAARTYAVGGFGGGDRQRLGADGGDDYCALFHAHAFGHCQWL